VSVKIPSVLFLSCSPIWNSEPLEEGSGSSVKIDFSDSFEKTVWMEVLGIDVEVNVWLLVELVAIEVFNSNTYIIIKFKV